MSVWQHVYNLIGKPIITEDKPGAQIEKVLDEIQEKAIFEIEGDEGEAGNTPVRIAVIKDAPNCVKLSGSVNLPASAWQGSEEITFITGVAVSLYVTGTATLGIRLGEHFQAYAPIMNENVFTNLWTGPFYGFERVIETFRFTGSPRRIKPIDIYYHTYSATKRASLNALHKVYSWALAQPIRPVFPSEFV